MLSAQQALSNTEELKRVLAIEGERLVLAGVVRVDSLENQPVIHLAPVIEKTYILREPNGTTRQIYHLKDPDQVSITQFLPYTEDQFDEQKEFQFHFAQPRPGYDEASAINALVKKGAVPTMEGYELRPPKLFQTLTAHEILLNSKLGITGDKKWFTKHDDSKRLSTGNRRHQEWYIFSLTRSNRQWMYDFSLYAQSSSEELRRTYYIFAMIANDALPTIQMQVTRFLNTLMPQHNSVSAPSDEVVGPAAEEKTKSPLPQNANLPKESQTASTQPQAALMEELRAKNQSLEAQISALQTQCTEQERTLKSNKSLIAEIEFNKEKDTKQLEAKLEAQNREMAALKAEQLVSAATIESIRSAANKENERLKQSHQEIKSKNAELESKNAELERQNRELRRQHAELTQQNTEIRTKLAKEEKKIEEKQELAAQANNLIGQYKEKVRAYRNYLAPSKRYWMEWIFLQGTQNKVLELDKFESFLDSKDISPQDKVTKINQKQIINVDIEILTSHRDRCLWKPLHAFLGLFRTRAITKGAEQFAELTNNITPTL